jgi:signal transduction histidine kinase
MSRFSPLNTLAILLVVAAGLLVAGIGLARRTHDERIDRDRAPLRLFSGDLQRELDRLERLYQKHLFEIARTAPLDNRQGIWQRCSELAGVRQFSLIHRPADRPLDSHLQIETPTAGQWPEPAFSESGDLFPRNLVILPQDELLSGAEESGWIDEPGKPLFFWLRRTPDQCVVLLLDPEAVVADINHWLETWIGSAFGAVRSAGGPDEVTAPGNRVLASVGARSDDRPDFILPVRTRFGTWQISSWDRHEKHVSYSTPILASAASLAVFIAAVGLSLSSQQRRLLRQTEERVSFVNAVSHELRVPLTNILLNLEIAHDAIGEISPEAARRLDLVREESQRLGRLIDNVLAFSRSEKRREPHTSQACIPADVIRSVLAQFAPSFQRRGVTVHGSAEAGAACLLDADGFAQIIANLLSNVEKYVPGGPVEVTSRVNDGALTVLVKDEGPGILPADAERIFQPFERLQTRVSDGANGAGLGLAISRDLAEAMGGSLRLLPSPRGASFELRLPAPAAPPPQLLSAG